MSGPDPYVDEDGEVRELDAQFFAKARLGRPPLPAEKRKRRTTIMLDADVIDRLKEGGKGWQTRANALQPSGLGL